VLLPFRRQALSVRTPETRRDAPGETAPRPRRRSRSSRECDPYLIALLFDQEDSRDPSGKPRLNTLADSSVYSRDPVNLRRHHARVVFLHVLLSLLCHWISFGPGVWILTHAVEREWSNLVRTRRIDVHLLAESIRIQQERTCPSLLQWRQFACRKRQFQFITRFRNDKHVVSCSQQTADVAESCVAPSHHFPRRVERHFVVIVAHRLSTVRCVFPGESTPTKIGDRRKEVRCF